MAAARGRFIAKIRMRIGDAPARGLGLECVAAGWTGATAHRFTMATDEQEILDANRAFYDAFESLEIERMEKVWLSEPRIVCIHPGWRKLEGWGPVMTSWERIFENVFEMKFELGPANLFIGKDLAVVVVEENLTQHGYDGKVSTQVLATNVFERVGGKWMMVLHHGSPVIAPEGSEPQLQ